MPEQKLDIQLRYAWDWFSHQTRQRLTAFNFFLILMGAIVVGYTQAVDDHLPALGACLGFLGVIVAVAFWGTEVRNEELVNCGRVVLDELERQLGVSITRSSQDRTRLAEAMRGPIEKRLRPFIGDARINHRTSLRLVIFVMGIASALGGGWAVAGFPGSGEPHQVYLVCRSANTSSCWARRT
jgi:hypothetical protein